MYQNNTEFAHSAIHWNSSTNQTMGTFRQSLQLGEYLHRYRKAKPNTGLDLRKPANEDILSKAVCAIFGSSDQKNTEAQSKCSCQRTEDGYCQLIMNWISEEYYWKTDPRFTKVYSYYCKRPDQELLNKNRQLLQQKIDILGVSMTNQQIMTIAHILQNYQKHVIYYNRQKNMLNEFNTHIWVALGIIYHMGLDNTSNMEPAIIFWAIDLMMNQFEDLSLAAISTHASNAIKLIMKYFPKWLEYLSVRNVPLELIMRDWIGQMLLGYIGMEFIAFFLQRFRQKKWNFVYQLILTYFQARVNALKTTSAFMNGQISNQLILSKLIDSREQWPMLFCQSCTFHINK